MKALHKRAKRSARERKEEAMLSQRTFDTLKLFVYLMCLSRNKRRGFGEKRLGETIKDLFNLLDYHTERYGSDCVVMAARKDLEARNIYFDIEGV